MLRRVHQTIVQRKMIRRGMHVVAAVSGGADSMAMLYALWFLRDKLGFQLSAAHLHHGLRARSADRDVSHVTATCARLGISCVVEYEAVGQARKRTGVSIEMAAREARHAFFRKTLRSLNADTMALAHHRNDQAETVLMRLLTGGGLEGLAGMDYVSVPAEGVPVIRPMLDVSRHEIEGFLERHRISWREDPSNQTSDFLRNRIRNRIMPFLAKQGFAGVMPSLNRLADIMREESALATKQTKAALSHCLADKHGNKLKTARIAALSVAEQRRLLRLWLAGREMGERGLDYATIERLRRLIHHHHGAVALSGEWRVENNGRHVELRRETPVAAKKTLGNIPLSVPGITSLPEYGLIITITAETGYQRNKQLIGRYPAEAFMTRTNKIPALLIRGRKAGDRMAPVGMSGSVLLKELFVNQKIPAAARDNIPVLECDGEIVWVAGYRIARRWAVPSPKARSWKIRIDAESRSD